MSTKRLSEKYSALHHATLGSVLDNFGLREEPEAMALRALEEDRLQAREDVKRLATELRECMRTVLIFHGPAGRSIYKNDSPEFKRWRALLSEVEAVRQ